MKLKQEKTKIMVVDDSPSVHRILAEKLRDQPYEVVGYTSGNLALKAVAKEPPDIILLDILMPEMDGFEFCKRLRAEQTFKDIPVIFSSAIEEAEEKAKAFEIGGSDYVTKPIQLAELKARINAQLKQQKSKATLQAHNLTLKTKLDDSVKEVYASQKATVVSLVELARARDNDTGYHIERTQEYCKILAETLGCDDNYKDVIDDDFIANIYHAAALHDIGKVAVPDNILLKPGRLNKEEFELIKSHSSVGAQILTLTAERYPWNNYLNMGADIALYHHEKWDGSGYPEGLSGTNIPLCARIMAVADVYDALRNERPYKKAYTHAETVLIIEKDSSWHFDPDIIEHFMHIEQSYAEIYDKLK